MRRHLWVLLAYLGLSLLLTWPLVVQIATHVPGDGIDDPALAWNLWWVKHSLVDQPQNPFTSNWIFWPIGINLAFYTLTILNGLLALPLQVTAGLVPAYNLLLLSSFVLGGYGAYLLCRGFLRREGTPGRAWHEPAAFLAGMVYAFASAKMFYAALGQGNIASSQWAPFAALYLVRTARRGARFHDVAMAALFLALQAYAELTYASFLAIFAGLLLAWAIFHHSDAPVAARWRLAGRFALVALLCGLALAPLLAQVLPDLRAEGDIFGAGGGFAGVFSADLAGYLLPTQLHPLLGGLVHRVANGSIPRPDGSLFAVDKGQQIYLGYTALALAVAGLWTLRRHRAAWFWAVAAALFFVLTLGPSPRFAGYDLHLPLPFALVEQLPFFKGNRYPSRYSVMLLLSLVPLLGAGLAASLAALSRRGRAAPGFLAAVALLLCFEHLSAPLPTFDLSVPGLYAQVAAQPGDFALLEVPSGWRNGARVLGKQDIVIMQELWFQTAHAKRLLGGNTSRNPPFKFDYFSAQPTLARLIADVNAGDVPQHAALRAALAGRPVTEDDRTQARKWAAFLDIRYVMVHRDRLPATTEPLLRALLPLEPVATEGPLALYAVSPLPEPPRAYHPGSPSGGVILGEGWSPPPGPGTTPLVWAQRREVRLLLPLRDTARLRLHAWAPGAGQALSVVVDGGAAGTQPLPEQPGWLNFELGRDGRRPAVSDVRLSFTTLTPVITLAGGPWPVGRTGASLGVPVLVRSAGEETGDYGKVYAGGQATGPDGRGYNLVAVDGAGRVGTVANFDTHADPQAGQRMAAWLAALPPGTLVAGAARDEASQSLDQAGVAALRTLGVAGDLRGHFRWGHAFVGAVGAPPGSALEDMAGDRPAQVSVGQALSAPTVAAALDEVGLDP